MRTSILIAVFLGACLTSCTGASRSSSTASTSDASARNDEAQILSQDECDRRAGDSISASNCDAEFDKLVREIEAEKDTDG